MKKLIVLSLVVAGMAHAQTTAATKKAAAKRTAKKAAVSQTQRAAQAGATAAGATDSTATAKGTTETPAAAAAPSASAIAPAAGTSAIATEVVAPSAKRNWGIVFINENFRSYDDSVKNDDTQKMDDAHLWSMTQIGGNYKFNDSWKLQATQQISSSTVVRDGTSNPTSGTATKIHNNNAVELVDPIITATLSTQTGILGSKALSHGFRVEPGLGKYSREMNRNGTLRYDTNLAWDVTSKLEASFAVSPRVILTRDDAAQKGNAIYRWVGGPAATYAFNDMVSAYTSYMLDTRSTEWDHGKTEANVTNIGETEIGLVINTKVGGTNLSINPAIDTDADLNKADGSMFTNESRFLGHETMSYYLAISATY